MFTWPDMYLSWGKALSGIPEVYVVRFENEMKEEGCNKDQGNGFHLPRWRICDWKQCRNQAQEHLTDQPLNLPGATFGLVRLCQVQNILRCRGSFACRCITGVIRFLAFQKTMDFCKTTIAPKSCDRPWPILSILTQNGLSRSDPILLTYCHSKSPRLCAQGLLVPSQRFQRWNTAEWPPKWPASRRRILEGRESPTFHLRAIVRNLGTMVAMVQYSYQSKGLRPLSSQECSKKDWSMARFD